MGYSRKRNSRSLQSASDGVTWVRTRPSLTNMDEPERTIRDFPNVAHPRRTWSACINSALARRALEEERAPTAGDVGALDHGVNGRSESHRGRRERWHRCS